MIPSEPRLAEIAARPSRLRLWWTAARPRTLSIALTPVVVGGAIAWSEGASLHLPVFLATLACALLIQIGTNLLNDVADFERGNDRPERVGPLRVTAAGWATPRQVRRAGALAFAVAALCGLGLVIHGGAVILVLGLASIAAGWAYSGGVRPVSHSPLGELFVLAFFGIVAVCGSHYLQSGRLSAAALAAGVALGAMAAAVLLVNNHRDVDGDRKAGRRTLAAVLGPGRSRALHAALMLLPFALPPWLAFGAHFHTTTLLALLALPLSLIAIRGMRSKQGIALNPVLGQTALAQLVFGALLAIGMLP